MLKKFAQMTQVVRGRASWPQNLKSPPSMNSVFAGKELGAARRLIHGHLRSAFHFFRILSRAGSLYTDINLTMSVASVGGRQSFESHCHPDA